MDVGIRELRTNLSRYVARVKQGEEIVVTEHGKPVVRLVPAAVESKRERLLRLGVLHPAQRPKGPLPPPIKLKSGVLISEIVIEQRGPY